MLSSLALAVLLSVAAVQDDGPIATAAPILDDGPIATAAPAAETVDSQRVREAIAYSNPMPPGAPEQDYPLVAWCDALVSGHIALGETLTNHDPLDVELIRLARLEAGDFRSALTAAEARQTPAMRRAATAAAAEATAKWTPLLANTDEAVRSQAFGLFFGLPGRCEHAARRIRDNITSAPVTPAEVGLEEATPAAAAN